MRVYVETYGCTMNQAHGEMIAGLLASRGYEVVESEEKADVIIVNSCAVKHPTECKILERVAKLVRSGKRVIVTGCLAELIPERIVRLGASVVSIHHMDRIPDAIPRVLRGELVDIHGFRHIERVGWPRVISNKLVVAVPVGYGCEGECAFCADRVIWGRYRSYPLEKIVEEVRKFVEAGAKEIRLCHHDTACYGWDLGLTLADLIERIAEIPGDFRVRIGMMSPNAALKIFDELLDAMAATEKVYRFFHIPVQSGSDRVLRLMRRKHTAEDFVRLVEKARARFPDAMIVTDIIVGFPGETDEDFEMTKKLIERVRPDFVHISKYGDRPRTPAKQMRPKVHSKVVKQRSRELACLVQRIALEKNRTYVGRVSDVLLLEKYEGMRGVNGRMNNYKRVLVLEELDLGQWVRCRIVDCTWRYLIGERC